MNMELLGERIRLSRKIGRSRQVPNRPLTASILGESADMSVSSSERQNQPEVCCDGRAPQLNRCSPAPSDSDAGREHFWFALPCGPLGRLVRGFLQGNPLSKGLGLNEHNPRIATGRQLRLIGQVNLEIKLEGARSGCPEPAVCFLLKQQETA